MNNKEGPLFTITGNYGEKMGRLSIAEKRDDAGKKPIYGRLTTNARHLHAPENKVDYFDMEGVLYEVDVHTRGVDVVRVRPNPGRHAKGAYTGQGRLVLANNGERERGAATEALLGEFEEQVDPAQTTGEEVGALGDWDGDADTTASAILI